MDEGSVQKPFSMEVAYHENDLKLLFQNHFTCSFCDDHLEITPVMMKFVVDFFNKPFHTSFMDKSAEITNGELSFYIPYAEKISSVEEFLNDRGVKLSNAQKYLPTISDVHLIQKTAKEFDSNHWLFRIESSNAATGYISGFDLWFKGMDL